jgi:hypothetical protein
MGVREELAAHFGDDLLFADSFDNAIIGVSIGDNPRRVVYDTRQMVEILVQEENFTEETAWEFLEFNTFSAHVGEHTPIYVSEMSHVLQNE